MIRLCITLLIATLFFSCNTKAVDKRIALDSATKNIVQLSDTLVILTSACKGCEFETTYGFTDSLGIVKESNYKSSDDCPECDGGSYQVEIEFVPLNTGATILHMYQHEWAMSDSMYDPEILGYERKPIIVDSSLIAKFMITVKNN